MEHVLELKQLEIDSDVVRLTARAVPRGEDGSGTGEEEA
jgi:hypothetical protein